MIRFLHHWRARNHGPREDGQRYRHRGAGQDRRAARQQDRGDTRVKWLDELVRQRLET